MFLEYLCIGLRYEKWDKTGNTVDEILFKYGTYLASYTYLSGIRTHNLLIISLMSQPLDQGHRPAEIFFNKPK